MKASLDNISRFKDEFVHYWDKYQGILYPVLKKKIKPKNLPFAFLRYYLGKFKVLVAKGGKMKALSPDYRAIDFVFSSKMSDVQEGSGLMLAGARRAGCTSLALGWIDFVGQEEEVWVVASFESIKKYTERINPDCNARFMQPRHYLRSIKEYIPDEDQPKWVVVLGTGVDALADIASIKPFKSTRYLFDIGNFHVDSRKELVFKKAEDLGFQSLYIYVYMCGYLDDFGNPEPEKVFDAYFKQKQACLLKGDHRGWDVWKEQFNIGLNDR